MTEENLHNERESRRFLLGKMSEAERFAFEENFIADEDSFELTRVVEDELIESFVRGTLSADEREKFERHFLSTEARRRRVAFARTMLDKLVANKEKITVASKIEIAEASSVWNSIKNFFKFPQIALAVSALLLMIFGGLIWLINPNQPEIVRSVTPTPTIEIFQPNQNSTANQIVQVDSNANIAETNSVNKNNLPNANRELTNKNQNSNLPKQNPINVTPFIALFAGTVRSEGKMSELNLPKNASGANLQLNLESQDYKIYRVEIVDPDGNLIVRNNNLKVRNLRINLFVPAAKLPKGEYIIKLSALNPNEENESVADYSFRVNRK